MKNVWNKSSGTGEVFYDENDTVLHFTVHTIQIMLSTEQKAASVAHLYCYYSTT